MSTTTRTASDKQVNFIKSLWAQASEQAAALSDDSPATASVTALLTPVQGNLALLLGGESISSNAASELITTLKAATAVLKASAPVTGWQWRKEADGFFVVGPAGVAVEGDTVSVPSRKAPDGAPVLLDRLVRSENGADFFTNVPPWEVEKRAAAEAARKAEQARRPLLDALDALHARLGTKVLRVAIPSLTGNNDLDFFVLRADHVARFLGGQGEVAQQLAQELAAVEAVAALSADELAEAAAAFGREIGQCGRCGRSLTDEHSRERGLGPDCASKGW